MGIIKIIGGMIFLYLVWRNLRNDYQDDRLVSYSWLAMAVFLVSGRAAYGLINWGVWNDSWVNWFNFVANKGFLAGIGFVGILVATYVFSMMNNWKPWSFFEDVMGIIFLFMAFFWVDDLWVVGFSWQTLALVGVMVFGFLTGEFLKGKYRSFSWYHSGKKGFAFFGANIVVGCLLALWSFLLVRQGVIWLVLYIGLSLVSLAGLLVLADIAKRK